MSSTHVGTGVSWRTLEILFWRVSVIVSPVKDRVSPVLVIEFHLIVVEFAGTVQQH